MRRLNQSFLARICPCFLLTGAANASVLKRQNAQQIFNSGDTFSLTLTKTKLVKGCKQKQYQLHLAKMAPMFNVEAIVHYNKGLLDYGVMSQRVRSHEFEVVSWWDRGDYRLGLSHKIRPRHE